MRIPNWKKLNCLEEVQHDVFKKKQIKKKQWFARAVGK